MKLITQAVISGSTFATTYKSGDIIGWISSLSQTHEILVDVPKGECYRIAIATTPSKVVGPGCRPYGIEDFIEKFLHLKLVGSAQR